MTQKISELPPVVTPAGTDEFEVNQVGTSKKETLGQIATYVASTQGALAARTYPLEEEHITLDVSSVPATHVVARTQSGKTLKVTGAGNIATINAPNDIVPDTDDHFYLNIIFGPDVDEIPVLDVDAGATVSMSEILITGADTAALDQSASYKLSLLSGTGANSAWKLIAYPEKHGALSKLDTVSDPTQLADAVVTLEKLALASGTSLVMLTKPSNAVPFWGTLGTGLSIDAAGVISATGGTATVTFPVDATDYSSTSFAVGVDGAVKDEWLLATGDFASKFKFTDANLTDGDRGVLINGSGNAGMVLEYDDMVIAGGTANVALHGAVSWWIQNGEVHIGGKTNLAEIFYQLTTFNALVTMAADLDMANNDLLNVGAGTTFETAATTLAALGGAALAGAIMTGAISGNGLKLSATTTGALPTTDSGTFVATTGAVTFPVTAIGTGFFHCTLKVGADTEDWTFNSTSLDISAAGVIAGQIYSVIVTSATTIDVLGPLVFDQTDFS